MAMKRPSHPGGILRETITAELGLSITQAARGLGVSRKQLSAILNERAGISPEMALRLEKAVGSTAEQWLRMQAAYDLAQVRRSSDSLRRLRKLGHAS